MHGTNAPAHPRGVPRRPRGRPCRSDHPPGAPAASIAEAWDPDMTIAVDGTVRVHREFAGRPLHPDLALLLSTSGSTGSPRLVRLSWENLRSNAGRRSRSTAVRPTDRADDQPPAHYCYGSASSTATCSPGLACAHRPVRRRPCFWDLARGHRTTTSPGCRTLRAARPDRVRRDGPPLPAHGHPGRRGGSTPTASRPSRPSAGREMDLFVMYGQTEATARMTYLPPDLAAEHPGTVGVPAAGRSRRPRRRRGRLLRAERHAGYASEPGDLALGRTTDRLHTGDLGRWTDADCSRSPAAGPGGARRSATGSTSSTSSAPCEPRAATWCVDGGPASRRAPVLPEGGLAERGGAPGRHPHAVRTSRGTAGLGPGRHPHLPTGKVDYATLGTLAASCVAAAPDAAASPGRCASGTPCSSAAPLWRPRTRSRPWAATRCPTEASLHVEERLGYLPRLAPDDPRRARVARAPPTGVPERLVVAERRLRGRVPTRSVESSGCCAPSRSCSSSARTSRVHAPGHRSRPARPRRLEPRPVPAQRRPAPRAGPRPAHGGPADRRPGLRRHRGGAPAHRSLLGASTPASSTGCSGRLGWTGLEVLVHRVRGARARRRHRRGGHAAGRPPRAAAPLRPADGPRRRRDAGSARCCSPRCRTCRGRRSSSRVAVLPRLGRRQGTWRRSVSSSRSSRSRRSEPSATRAATC